MRNRATCIIWRTSPRNTYSYVYSRLIGKLETDSRNQSRTKRPISRPLAKGSLWTTSKLLEKALSNPAIPADQRFVAQALRAVTLSKLCEMVEKPDYIKTESGIAQARWALSGRNEASLREELHASATAAWKSFAVIDRPTRQHRTLKTRLDAVADHLTSHDTSEEGASPDNL